MTLCLAILRITTFEQTNHDHSASYGTLFISLPNCFVKSWMLLKSRQIFFQMVRSHTLFIVSSDLVDISIEEIGCHLWWLRIFMKITESAQCAKEFSQKLENLTRKICQIGTEDRNLDMDQTDQSYNKLLEFIVTNFKFKFELEVLRNWFNI